MSNRKRHTYKLDFLRKVATSGAVSHCEGGSHIPTLERLEKQGLVERYRYAYGAGWSNHSNYSLSRTAWRATEKGMALVKKLDGQRMAPMRIHNGGFGYWPEHRMHRAENHRARRLEDEADRNAKYAQGRQEIVNPPKNEEPIW